MLAMRDDVMDWCDWHDLPNGGAWVTGLVLFSWDWDCWMCQPCVENEWAYPTKCVPNNGEWRRTEERV